MLGTVFLVQKGQHTMGMLGTLAMLEMEVQGGEDYTYIS